MRKLLCPLPLVLLAALGSAQTRYRITDLGTLPGGGAIRGTALNASGQVAGTVAVGGDLHAFRWSNGAMTDLGSVGVQGEVNAINASGQIAGGLYESGTDTTRAFETVSDAFQTLASPFSCGRGLDDAGRVVGYSNTGSTSSFAMSWGGGVAAYLPSPYPLHFGYAYAMNVAGKVVGSVGEPGTARAAFWIGRAVMFLGAAGSQSRAYAVNRLGDAVGSSGNVGTTNLYTTATMWSNGQEIPLGALYGSGTTAHSVAYGINASRTVVGADSGTAFVWSNGTIQPLSSLVDVSTAGWTFASAAGINDAGQIVGTGTVNGQTRAFLATPVPEPGVFASLSLGGLALLRRRRAVSAS